VEGASGGGNKGRVHNFSYMLACSIAELISFLFFIYYPYYLRMSILEYTATEEYFSNFEDFMEKIRALNVETGE
jgi:hypothetical protein